MKRIHFVIIFSGSLFLALMSCHAETAKDDETLVLLVAADLLQHPNQIGGTKVEDLYARLPESTDRYRLALISWALLKPNGIEEANRSKHLEAIFWLAFRSLCQPTEKAFALRILDECQLKSGDLALALELLYRGDEEGLHRELQRRGIK